MRTFIQSSAMYVSRPPVPRYAGKRLNPYRNNLVLKLSGINGLLRFASARKFVQHGDTVRLPYMPPLVSSDNSICIRERVCHKSLEGRRQLRPVPIRIRCRVDQRYQLLLARLEPIDDIFLDLAGRDEPLGRLHLLFVLVHIRRQEPPEERAKRRPVLPKARRPCPVGDRPKIFGVYLRGLYEVLETLTHAPTAVRRPPV